MSCEVMSEDYRMGIAAYLHMWKGEDQQGTTAKGIDDEDNTASHDEAGKFHSERDDEGTGCVEAGLNEDSRRVKCDHVDAACESVS